MRPGRKFLLTNLLYLKVFLAFALGIIAAEFIENTWVTFSLPLLIFGLFQLTYTLIKSSRSKYLDSLIFSTIFTCGIIFHSFSLFQKAKSIEDLSPILDLEATHLVRIEDKPLFKTNSLQLEATLLKSKLDTTNLTFDEKILIYLPKESLLDSNYYGQILQLQGRLVKPNAAHYSFEFDYAKWLARKKIYTTLYSKNFQLINRDSRQLYQLSKLPYKMRDYFDNEIDRIILDPSSNAIAKSILIGVRSDIDRDLYTAYADTGTIHILSISGLHFGILILFLEYILSFFIKREGLRILAKHSISFLYALMTGFSAPILRSFIMFVFFDVGKWKQTRTSSYNILFLSAWIILIYDTNQIFNIGFQFSYCALLGIMLIYQRAVWKIQFNSIIPNFIWKSTITLIAAWLFTAPLTIFYYYKFSWIGSLSNILVVPITTLIMYIGFIFLLFSKIEFLSNLLGCCLTLLINIQNTIIKFFSQLPYASINSNALDNWGFWLLILFIATLMIVLYTKNKLSFRIMSIFLIIFIFYSSFHSSRLSREENWFLVSNYKHSAVIYKNKNNLYVFADSIDENTNRFFLNSMSAYYATNPFIVYSSSEYISNIKNYYSFQYAANPRFLLLSKENKNLWNEYINKRDSFVIMTNVGYHKSDLIASLKQKNKFFYVY
jgi:competence protein ComEC